MGGGCDSNEGKMLEEGMSGGGGEQPQIANSISSSLLGTNSLVMINHTHKIRTIQQINKKAAIVRVKMVLMLVINILVKLSGGLGMK
jgi:hypothetical protein